MTNFSGRRTPKSATCEHCSGRRLVWNELLQKSIPCPQCRRKPRQDAAGMQAIKAAEKRRMERLVSRAVGLEIAKAMGSRVTKIDTEYATSNRIMERWAVGHGSGLPRTDEEMDALAREAQEFDIFTAPECKPPGLDDVTQVIIDRIIGVDPRHHQAQGRTAALAVPEPIARFVWQWYCSDVPCSVLAQQRGIRHEDIYDEWRAVLNHVKFRFLTSGHRDLVSMVNGQL